MRILLFLLLMGFPLLWAQDRVWEIGELPMEVHESSGLIFYNGYVITHNDSGNTPQLFEIDTVSLQIKRIVTVSGAENVDWEDIDQDEHYIYIGDFGNNVGTRQNLSVYRISKEEYDRSDTVSAEQILFTYEDQTDFGNHGNSDWDAEAFFVQDDQLVLLTKQWQSHGTVAYSLPKIPGTYTARRLDSKADMGLVTGATYNPSSKELLIIGYSPFLEPYIVKVEGTTRESVFEGNIEKWYLDIGVAQVEGITYTGFYTYLFSSEFFSMDLPPITSTSRLFGLKTTEPVESPEEPIDPEPEEPEPQKDKLILFQRGGSNLLEYKLVTDEQTVEWALFDSAGKRLRYSSAFELHQEAVIDISGLRTSIYYLAFYLKGGMISKPFYKY